MAKTYVTKAGDSFDKIAYHYYGAEKFMKNIIEANVQYADVLRFSAGTKLVLPDIIEQKKDYGIPAWRLTS